MNEMMESSKEIAERAVRELEPYAIVAMISGGKDSLAAYLVAKELGVKITHICHGVTGTGIPQTTQFVREFAEGEAPTYLEADAGTAYEEYIHRKGFFGVGQRAHSFTYHILKRQRFTSVIAGNIRHRKKGREILLINGSTVRRIGQWRSWAICVPAIGVS